MVASSFVQCDETQIRDRGYRYPPASKGISREPAKVRLDRMRPQVLKVRLALREATPSLAPQRCVGLKGLADRSPAAASCGTCSSDRHALSWSENPRQPKSDRFDLQDAKQCDHWQYQLPSRPLL